MFLHGFVKVTTHGFIKVSILDYSNGVKGNCFMPHRKYLSLCEKIFAKLYWEMWENPTAELLGNIFAQLAIFVIPLLKCSLHPLNLCFCRYAICLATLFANFVKYEYFTLLLCYLKRLSSFQLQHKGCEAWGTVLNWRKAFCTEYFAKVCIL